MLERTKDWGRRRTSDGSATHAARSQVIRMPRLTRTRPLAATVLLAGLPMLAQCKAAAPPQGPANRSPTPGSTSGVVRAETVAEGLEHPWGLAFLPDGRILVTERPGRLRIVDQSGGLSAPIAGVPAVAAGGQGGLLDVALDPGFADNRLIYLSYAEPGDGGAAGTAVARGRLGDGRLEDVSVIYRQEPKVRSSAHFGSRLVFARDGMLYVTQGAKFVSACLSPNLRNLNDKGRRICLCAFITHLATPE